MKKENRFKSLMTMGVASLIFSAAGPLTPLWSSPSACVDATVDGNGGIFPLACGRTKVQVASLHDGRVLIAGGAGLCDGISQSVAETEIFSFETGKSHASGAMVAPREGHALVVLADGRVLAVGGTSSIAQKEPATMPLAQSAHRTAEIFDPATQSWVFTGDLKELSGAGLQALLLHNGQVLVVGSHSAELFNPVLGCFKSLGNTQHDRVSTSAVLLTNGQVLLVGPDRRGRMTAECYLPMLKRFVAVGNPQVHRNSHFTLTLLKDGRVLLAGGNGDMRKPLAEIYDPRQGRFAAAFTMHRHRTNHTATLLEDGSVALVGGYGAKEPHETGPFFNTLKSVEVFQPENNTFEMSKIRLQGARQCHAVAVNQKGNPVLFGGECDGAAIDRAEVLNFYR